MVKTFYAVLALLVLVGMVSATEVQKDGAKPHHQHENKDGGETFANVRPPGAQNNQGAFPKPPPSPKGGFVQRLRDFIHI